MDFLFKTFILDAIFKQEYVNCCCWISKISVIRLRWDGCLPEYDFVLLHIPSRGVGQGWIQYFNLGWMPMGQGQISDT